MCTSSKMVSQPNWYDSNTHVQFAVIKFEDGKVKPANDLIQLVDLTAPKYLEYNWVPKVNQKTIILP